jgi:murein DD-endopeptidase MepM/ murein hydrolase activator NlpD
MKKTVGFIITLCIAAAIVGGASAQERQKKNRFQRAVDSQREGDLARKKELIKKMKSILGEYNSRLRKSGIKDADLVAPIDMDKMEKIEDDYETHSKDADKPKVFAFVTDNGSIYASSAGTDVVGRVLFAERVQILEKVNQESHVDGKRGQWVAIRKDNDNEGWLHSSYLAAEKPLKRFAKTDGESLVFDVPVSGKKTSAFGSRVDPVTKKRGAFHTGIDIAAPMGTDVKAAEEGTVRKTEYNKNGYGNLIIIEHKKDFTTYYGHLSRINVKMGQFVKKGDSIGAVGSTGKSTGPHLHFEVRRGEKALDPDAIIR